MNKVGQRKAASISKWSDAINSTRYLWQRLRIIIFIVFLGLSIILLHGQKIKLRDYIDGAAVNIYQPFHSLMSWLRGTNYHHLQEGELQAEVTYNPIEADIQIAALLAETQQLKQLLHLHEHNTFHTIAVRILGHSRGAGGHRLLIGAGTKDGIKDGAAVFNQEGLIGQVFNASQHAAWVMTLNDPHSKVPVVLSVSRRKAVAMGDASGSGMLNLKYLISNEYQKEIALTAGEGGTLPYGLYVGKLIEYEDELYLESSVQWHKLDYALVGIQKEEG